MQRKIIVGLLIIACTLPPAILGGFYIKLLVFVIDAFIAYEANTLFGEKPNWVEIILNIIVYVGLYYVGNDKVLSCVVAWLMILFLMHISAGEGAADRVTYPFLITMLVGIASRTVVQFYSLESLRGFSILFYICVACFTCDTAAYFFGTFFGKHKFAPKVSPNKTWEGTIGGYLVGAILSFITSLFLLKNMPMSLRIVSSLILPFVGIVGDLSFSLIKRKFNLKDFGSVLPGHGGLLDRVDSLIFCLLAFYGFMVLWGL
ncbi:MAG: CDP-archaeol synthase [Solobacterium sp.]|nr:CDP-archaeol synthase [Solobacterium sp.]